MQQSPSIPHQTPMMAQYLDIKAQHPDCLLFYRLGDFYELFFEDALIAAKALNITLTRRGKGKEGEDIPMCGVPFHRSDSYLARLIRQGYRVAICEQVEEAGSRKTKGPLERKVTRVITPGTLTEDSLLDATQHNFLTAVVLGKQPSLGLASIDISTGDFLVESTSLPLLETVLARLRPGEILLPEGLLSTPDLEQVFQTFKKRLTPLPDSRFDRQNGLERLQDLYGVRTLESFGTFSPSEIAACGALVDYIRLTQKRDIPALKPPRQVQEEGRLELDAATRRNLELHFSLSGEKKGSLREVIDHTMTSMGARLLSQHLSAPLRDLSTLHKRLACVDVLYENPDLLKALRALLAICPDVERSLSRLMWGRGGPRDLAALHRGLALLPDLKKIFANQTVPPALDSVLQQLGDYGELTHRLNQALREELPLLARDGALIRPGYHPDLDELWALKENGKDALEALRDRYARETGIPSLKIKYNNVIGYHIEVTSLHKDKMGPSFIHRQTMANAMRFTTSALLELEKKILGSVDQALALELEIFQDLINITLQRTSEITRTAYAIAALDVSASHAYLAHEKRYNRPLLDESLIFDVEEGRHPVVEALLPSSTPFVPNGATVDGVWIITGPNMGGKSTFLRQNALIALMAHMGMYVPAKRAHIGLIDRIFSRVGASDDLARGRSTFMVEMTETATILNQATPRSFVILDEIGRGTATFDGLSLAWACVEYLVHKNQSRCLFATHYHELTVLEDELSSVTCYTVGIREWEDQIIFLHQIQKGRADKSYGLHVAKLAGFPLSVVERAQEVLHTLEEKFPSLPSPFTPVNLPFEREGHPHPTPLEKALSSLDPDRVSPREALEILYSLKKLTESVQ